MILLATKNQLLPNIKAIAPYNLSFSRINHNPIAAIVMPKIPLQLAIKINARINLNRLRRRTLTIAQRMAEIAMTSV